MLAQLVLQLFDLFNFEDTTLVILLTLIAFLILFVLEALGFELVAGTNHILSLIEDVERLRIGI